MEPTRVRLLSLSAVPLFAALAVAGCGGSEEEKSTVSRADLKAQVEQVCREATQEIDAIPDPLDTESAAQAQGRSAQIFKTAVGKLNELNSDVGFPESYKAWLAEFEQLPALNEKAAEAFSGDGLTSGQAESAGQAWEAQANKANALARTAGLSDCVFGQVSAG